MGQREMCIECRVYMTGVESLEIWGAIKDQWKSMTGMAAMFTLPLILLDHLRRTAKHARLKTPISSPRQQLS